MPENDDRPDGTGSNDQSTDRVPVKPGQVDEPDETIRIAAGDLRDDLAADPPADESDAATGQQDAPNGDEAESETQRIGREPKAEETQTIGIVTGRNPDTDDATASSAGTGSDEVESDTRRIEREPDAEETQTIGIVPVADTERTQAIPAVPPAPPQQEPVPHPAQASGGPQPTTAFSGPLQPEPTQTVPAGGAAGPGPETNGPADPKSAHRGLVRAGIIAAAVLGVLVVLYVADLAMSSGKVPRGTEVAGVAIGGMDKASAERTLRERLGPALDEPITLKADDATAVIQPNQAGLRVDWAATVEHAGPQSLNPFTRLTSLFSSREVVPVSHGDRARLSKAIEAIKPRLDRAPTEGAIVFEGTQPKAVEPVAGREVNVAGATDAVLAEWVAREPVRVPFSEHPVSTTEDGVRDALKDVAEPAVSAPVTVQGERGVNATLAPDAIARALKFEPDGEGGLQANVDVNVVRDAVRPQLASTLVPGKDATFTIEGGRPVVHPSVDGHGVDWTRSFEKLVDVLKKEDDRTVRAIYQQQPARFTTEQANQLGIREVVSEFTTGGFETASGVNIQRVAEEVNGAVVKPGETFSLNGHTGPRGTAQGYVESGIIEDGRPSRAVGGGISQFATTLYNASYFAGMEDVEHKEHSYYISRYPEGREATVFQNPDGSSVIDVKFKNTSSSGILITTAWTPESITVQFWGTKQYEVTSETSERSDPTQPEEKVVPPGEPCSASSGSPGFTVYDTRTIRDLRTGEVRTEEPTRTVYDPQPIVHCGAPAPPG